MRILITGSRGQLGNELKRCLSTMKAEVGPIPVNYLGAMADYVDCDELDISDPIAVSQWMDTHAYDLVINCAAITDVDGCETDEKTAYKVNALGPKNLAKNCAIQGAKFVHVSTDYVFPGDTPGERVETDVTGPISAYGRTKLAGEQFALAANPRTFICRSAWLYGYVGKNFVKTMRSLGRRLDEVTVVNDQLGNPTSANDLAYEILKIALTDAYGIYHVTNEGTCSWAELAARIMEKSNLSCNVVPVSSMQYKQANPESANRPHYSALKNQRLTDTVGNEMRPWQEALDSYLQHLPELEG
ncbi:dTDP-4-dehydrorhamnose reductase [Adlercreutzia sp. ZJ473]|uniref:dTDP-4-dehydrorhamnose reductase n=1 Tax=Adlercreutzia sp. ZJ473 TaxID=2722822 RepID=UPI0015549F39|nr:dTDP-4-dehydrorhamnose reductase [Adlercreutzia sp. ZJ473]